jgi:hypothetical protein
MISCIMVLRLPLPPLVGADHGSAILHGESMVKFEGSFLSLEHPSVSVGTSRLMSVHVNCIQVDQITNKPTQYDGRDVNGKVQVAAHKNQE